MNKLFTFAVVSLLSGLLISTAHAGKSGVASTGTAQGEVKGSANDVKAGQLTDKKQAYSVDKEYKKRVDAKNKAMKMRNRMIQQNK